MTVEADVPTARQLVIPIEITGTAGLEERIVDLEIAHLGQGPTGAWAMTPLGEPAPTEFTAAEWLTVPASITVPTASTVRVDVQAELPRFARGTYAAALLISTRPPVNEEANLRLSVRFLIPIILTVQGRPVRQDIQLTGAALELVDDADPSLTPEEAAETRSTFLNVDINNRGATYSRISGDIFIDYAKEADRWQQVRTVSFDDRRILPGIDLSLPIDLERRLPEGNYRIRGELFVDGRRTLPLRQEIFFEGDPDVTDIAAELSLRLDPDVFEFEYVGGATRAGVITVENPGIEPITVDIGVMLPEDMGGRATRELRGESLSAAQWVEVMPRSFTLRPSQSRNVRLVARFPLEELEFENYYAALSLDGRYSDGQKAGEAQGFVEISRNRGDDPGAVFQAYSLSADDTIDKYVLSTRIANVGNVLLEPSVQYQLINEDAAIVLESRLSTADGDVLMPLASRSFGGVLSMDGLVPGDYALQTRVISGGETVARYAYAVTHIGPGDTEFTALGNQPID